MPLDPRPLNIIVKSGQRRSTIIIQGKRSKLLSLGVEMLQVSPSLLWLFLRGNTLTTNGQ